MRAEAELIGPVHSLRVVARWWPISARSRSERGLQRNRRNISSEIQEFHDRSGVLNGSQRVQQGVR